MGNMGEYLVTIHYERKKIAVSFRNIGEAAIYNPII